MLRALLLLLCTWMAACSSSGRLFEGLPSGQDFDLTKAHGIQDGVTTKAEVQAMFGRPGSTNESGDYETWTYTFQRVHPGREKTWGAGTLHAFRTRTETSVSYRKMLMVTFDQRGIVQSHMLTETGRP